VHWKEYDEKAEWLERKFADEVPLFDWRVARADTMAVKWRTFEVLQFSSYDIVATVELNGERLKAQAEIDADILDTWETENLVDYIGRLVAYNVVQSIMEWKPKN
jgi:hypothetical protein